MLDDMEAQPLPPQHQRNSAISTAFKLGATVLCGAALAAAMIAALKDQTVDDNNFQPMRMLAGNDTDPCAELNENGGRYTPLDRPKSLRDATIASILFGSMAAPCLFGMVVSELRHRLGREDGRDMMVSCCICAAFPMIGFGVAIALYAQFKGMTDGQCWDNTEGWEGSRG